MRKLFVMLVMLGSWLPARAAELPPVTVYAPKVCLACLEWAEHLRQHERSTRADRDFEQRVHGYVDGVPTVRHLVLAS